MLEVYRDFDINSIGERSFHVIPLVKSDIYDIRLSVLDEELNPIEGIVIRWPFFQSMGFSSAVERKPEVISEIRSLLRDGTSLPIYRELLISAQNNIWRGQYRLVPVEANSAFESFVPKIIFLLDKTVNRTELKDLYSKLLKLEEVLSIALRSSSNSEVAWFTLPADGWKTLIQSELLNWYSDCYLLRNKVIHEGYNKVTNDEAKKSYTATISAINYIQCELNKFIK
ncbi:MAG: hypothetical protein AB9891_01635 [Anaerolineaceae bacterium]